MSRIENLVSAKKTVSDLHGCSIEHEGGYTVPMERKGLISLARRVYTERHSRYYVLYPGAT